MTHILLLDDEANILTALRRLLQGEDWQVDTFTDAEYAGTRMVPSSSMTISELCHG